MVNLGDYIGLILSELASARVQADIESVRMAEFYSANKILRNFAIPRVRFQNVEITTPVVIDKADEDAIATSRMPMNISEVRNHVDQIVTTNLEKNGVKLSTPEMASLKKVLDTRSSLLEKSMKTDMSTASIMPPTTGTPASDRRGISMIDTKNLSDEFTKEVDTEIRKLMKTQPTLKNVDIDKISRDIKTDLRARLASIRPPPPRLQVLVNTSQIKEAGPKEIITMLKFVINEDAMEWTSHETDTGVVEQLVPE